MSFDLTLQRASEALRAREHIPPALRTPQATQAARLYREALRSKTVTTRRLEVTALAFLDVAELERAAYQRALSTRNRRAAETQRQNREAREVLASAKKVRAWAKAQGIPCSPRGVVPQHVYDAYATAHPQEDTP